MTQQRTPLSTTSPTGREADESALGLCPSTDSSSLREEMVWAVVFAMADRRTPARVREAVASADEAVAQLRRHMAEVKK